MMGAASYLAADTLIDAARSEGCSISRAQLARWHRQDWLPRPRRRSLGKGLGTESLYPSEALPRLLTVCSIHQRQRHSPLVEWELWWAGIDIEMFHVRRFLQEAADRWAHDIACAMEGDDLSEVATQEVEQATNKRFGSSRLRRARKRIGSRNFDQFASIMIRVATGTFVESWNSDEAAENSQVVAKGLGLNQRRRYEVSDAFLPRPENLEPLLVHTASLINPKKLCSILPTISNITLSNARDTARTMLALLDVLEIVSPTKQTKTRPYTASSQHSADLRAMLLLGCLAFNRDGFAAEENRRKMPSIIAGE